jgi:hypothetical protein
MSFVVSVPPSPTSGAAIEFVCPAVPGNGLDTADGCPAAYTAIETAVVHLGLPVDSITVLPYDFPCHQPFSSSARGCSFPADGPNGAYVTFVGTDEIAALTITRLASGPMMANLVDFRVPPAGWSVP